MYIYLNGQFIRREEATISPFDHGYLYGLGVFETMRTYEGNAFLLDQHVERLNSGMKEMNIALEFSTSQVEKILKELSRLNDLQNSYIRFNVSAGIGEIGLQTNPYSEPTVIVFQKPLVGIEPLREKEAVILKTVRNTPETTIRIKSHHFFNNVAAKLELGADPNKEGLMLTKDGFIAEGVTSNIFWLRDGVLCTPSLETGILNGITRQFIIRIAQELGIDVKIGLFKVEDLGQADEIFFTNSVQEIIPVNKLDKHFYPGKNGRLVQQLYSIYHQAIKKDGPKS